MDKAAVKTAVEYLIETKRYVEQKKYVLETISNWPKRQIRFAGEDAPMNALVELGLESAEALTNVFGLVERKRRTVPNSKKMDYQRDYMRQRRQRIVKAIKLEEIVRGARMTDAERTAYSSATLAEWTKQREAVIAKHPEASWKERNQIAGQFWETVDKQLDHDLAEAKKVLDAPGHRKVRTVQVRQPKGILGAKLKEALTTKRSKPKKK